MVTNTNPYNNLKPVQREVLDLLLLGTSPNKIAIRRGTSVQAVYKTINQLIEKKVLLPNWKKGLKKTYARALTKSKNLKTFYRLHGVEFHIKPLFFSKLYDKERLKNTKFTFYNWTIRLYKESIEVYSGISQDWRAGSISRVTKLMEQDFNRIIQRLENRLKIIIVKNQKLNIREVNHHYSHVNNGIARNVDKEEKKLTIYGKDGKARFKIDTSHNLIELEGIHPDTAKKDMELVCEKHLNDWADNDPPTISEVMKAVYELAKHSKETAAGLNAVTTILKMQMQTPKKVHSKDSKEKPNYVG
jgi:hypothetical protein